MSPINCIYLNVLYCGTNRVSALQLFLHTKEYKQLDPTYYILVGYHIPREHEVKLSNEIIKNFMDNHRVLGIKLLDFLGVK